MSSVTRSAYLLLALLLVVAIAACHVQIAGDGTFEVYGTNPEATQLPTATPSSGIPTPGPTPTPHIVTPTPIYDGKLSDWNILGVEHVSPTPTPRPTPTPSYQEGELILSGNGSISVATFTVPRGRYDVTYRVTNNDDHTYCITYVGLSVGCTSGAVGNIDNTRRVTISSHGALSIAIAQEARYTLVFARVD